MTICSIMKNRSIVTCVDRLSLLSLSLARALLTLTAAVIIRVYFNLHLKKVVKLIVYNDYHRCVICLYRYCTISTIMYITLTMLSTVPLIIYTYLPTYLPTYLYYYRLGRPGISNSSAGEVSKNVSRRQRYYVI